MAKLDLLLTEVTTCLRTLPGLEEVPERPTEGVNAFPALIVYGDRGATRFRTHVAENGNQIRNAVHTIVVVVSVGREDISRDLLALMPYADAFPARLLQTYAETRFNDTVVCLGDGTGNTDITYETTFNTWWINTVDLKFSMTVTVEEEVL